MFSTYATNPEEFKDLINNFSQELNFPFNEFSIKKEEDKFDTKTARLYYIIDYSDEENKFLRLFVEILKDKKNGYVKEENYTLNLSFSDCPAQFYFTDKKSSQLDRWLSHCLNEINEYKRTPFDYYFYNSSYLNYGIDGLSDTTAYLFRITLFGILKTNDAKQVWVARILHIREGDLYRSYSYAILPYGSNYWLIFPDAVGLDSGGARGGYESIEKSIKEAQKQGEIKIKIIDINSTIDEFKNKFKALYPKDFEPPYRENLYERVIRIKENDAHLAVFFTEIQRIVEETEKKEHMLVLRDMRAFIHGICKHICKINGIPVKADPRITDLSVALLEKKIINLHIKHLLEAFNSIANEAAHEIDSSKAFAMEPEIKHDLFDTTIKLGEHLILQFMSKV